jgi:anti-sigma factor ChrR (cupin superfamily)
MHVPVQALSQQTPSMQLLLPHSLPPPQAAPIGLRHSLPVVFIHIPSVLHTCGVVPTHWRRPGTHWPPQAEFRHTKSHVSLAT